MAIQHDRLIAVYDTDNDARAAVRALTDSGVAVAEIGVDERRDHVSAVEGEMRGEMAHTVAGPGNVGPWTKEMSEGSLLGVIVGGIIGVILALPFAAFSFGGMALWTRLVTVAIVGALVGATAGWIIAGGFAAKRPDEPLAAEEGVTVSAPLSDVARDVLVGTNPRRVDIVEPDGHPISVVVQRDAGPTHVVRDIRRHMEQEDRRG